MSTEKDKFEDMFRERFDDFEADVNPGVWKNIQAGLKGAGIGVLIKGLINKIGSNAIVAVVSSAATVIGTMAVMHYDTQKKETKKAQPTVVVEIPKPAKVNDIKEFLSQNEEKQEQTAKQSAGTAAAEPKADVISNKDKKHIAEVISELSDQTIASISSSTIGGSVPLIVNFTNEGKGKINKWNFGDGSKDNSANPIHVYDVPGIYTVQLTSTASDGKVSVDSVVIEVSGNSSLLTTIKTFSPNGDGENDTFFFMSENIKDMNTQIFDEKGNLVYSQKGTDFKWDGNNLRGKPAPVGSYIFIVNSLGVDGKKYEKKGKINLTR